MQALLGDNGLDRRPHNVAPNCWYYEEKKGLHIYCQPPGKDAVLIGIIGWRSVSASLKRHLAGRSKKRKA